ncbi:MAG: hydantoinase/oxoprolinase family protein [Anaerolineae bacterium]|nr:hydantoinase/oxoprolinase family protein [Anaerolineae bacterium]
MHRLLLGVDTGGTYTDAVALSVPGAEVVASAKALTTRADLALGIGRAVAGLEGVDPAAVVLACLSTTLATNAIVEGHGGRVCLVLIGYDPELIEVFGFRRDLVVDDVVFVEGGHDVYGRAACPLDEGALRRVARERAGHVDAFAISDYLGVRNPEHELRAAELLTGLTGLPVTCGHELSEDLNSVRRATTVALNARLIPLLRDLLLAVRRALTGQGVRAPLMLVKGDGSLMSADLALQHPVETVLSGPAASVLGARHLTGREDLLVVDMGGTTTDLAILRGGRPRASRRGAWVGGWRTLVRAVDTRSVGLGGDSIVALERGGELRLGPERVVPLSLAAAEDPSLVEGLERLLSPERQRPGVPQFFSLIGRSAPSDLTETEAQLLAFLQGGVRSLEEIGRQVSWAQVYLSYPNRLEAGGFVQRISFTPTDALHVLGAYAPWSRQAALLGATILGRRLGMSSEDLAAHVCGLVTDRIAAEIVAQVAADETGDERLLEGRAAAFFLGRALHPERRSVLDVSCRLGLPIAAVGAPVRAYFPQMATRLGAELLIPEHAEVANAIGAASGGVVQTVEVRVEPEYDVTGIGSYQVYSSEDRREFVDLDEALSYAREAGRRLAVESARRAGAEEIVVHEERQDQRGSLAEPGDSLYLGTRLRFTAAGRPRMGVEEQG